jgi:peroxin-1
MQSHSKLAPLVSRNGIQGTRGNAARQDHHVATVEIDATFARLLGISDGLKVSLTLHVDPPQAHTVNIEPLTPTDWDMIELHARFLEMNFLSQVRALPNPAFSSQPHPLTRPPLLSTF